LFIRSPAYEGPTHEPMLGFTCIVSLLHVKLQLKVD